MPVCIGTYIPASRVVLCIYNVNIGCRSTNRKARHNGRVCISMSDLDNKPSHLRVRSPPHMLIIMAPADGFRHAPLSTPTVR